MTEIACISDQLRRAHEGNAWHGPSLEEILEGVDGQTALHRPIARSHNIWEITLHIAVWESAALRRLSGEVVRTVKPEEDWPPVSDATEAAWQNSLDQLRRGHTKLRERIARLSDRQLDEPVPEMGYDVYFLLHGVVQHALYHAGQIAILKKAAG